MSVTIRPLETIDEFHAAETLQRVVWPGSETEVTPAHVLTTVAHNGGMVLGAFDGRAYLVANGYQEMLLFQRELPSFTCGNGHDPRYLAAGD